ncbi:hypothetical protein INT44_003546 [Umbelopsis vinacea]|uniref:R3H-associated N-terminal domain-containing protein n=1 Tax=Umbelopsis vinacea TaxID=44442 RepID=A0A8H7PUH7_9FUNG|nr:hypothetical protein INT44_003546 [Umbelopsis vinacea]KAI9289061.1 hypothetical protein BC943DRAFT_334373 [Umbelopsis sp. AD052]
MLSTTVIFRTNTNSAILSEEEELSRQKLAQARKKRFWLERDSLNRRNQLLVGREGSRRRQRWDNNNFTDHPFAAINPADLRPPGYADLPKFHWADDEAIANITSDDIDRMCRSQDLKSTANHVDYPLHRSIRQDLKKSHIPEGLVAFYDEQIRQFMQRSIVKETDSLEQDWVIVDETAKQQPSEPTAPPPTDMPLPTETSVFLVWEIGDRFSRWIIHTMSQFYNLSSFSE